MGGRKTDIREFDYKKIAEREADVWWAYYNRRYLRIFLRFLQSRSQIGLNWFQTLRAAYHITWAGVDYRINRGKVNERRVAASLTKFYKIISSKSTEPFDCRKAAKLELAWWNIHRSSYKVNKDLERGIAEAAAIVYHINPGKLKDFARFRAQASILPQHEADKDQPTPPDWHRVHQLLVKSWQSLSEAVKAEDGRKAKQKTAS